MKLFKKSSVPFRDKKGWCIVFGVKDTHENKLKTTYVFKKLPPISLLAIKIENF